MCLLGKNVRRSGIPAEKIGGIVDIAGGGSSAPDPLIFTAMAGLATQAIAIMADIMAIPVTIITMAIIAVDIRPPALVEFTGEAAGRCG